MAWPSDTTLHAALRTWFQLTRLEGLWTGVGPTARAVDLREQDDGSLSVEERAQLLAAFSLWKDRGRTSLEPVYELDDRNLVAFCTLFRACAVGDAAVEAWTAKMAASLPERRSMC